MSTTAPTIPQRPSLSSPTAPLSPVSGSLMNEKLESDLHELSEAFKVRVPSGAATVEKCEVVLTVPDSWWYDSKDTTVETQTHGKAYGLEMELKQYPKALTLKLHASLVKALSQQQQDLPWDTEGHVDLHTLLSHPWSEEDDNLYDTILLLNAMIERVFHLCRNADQPFILDYAHPPHTHLYFGRYDLLSSNKMARIRALYDFDAKDETELAFNTGDVIDVVYERADGWCLGVLNGLSGLVPRNHVEDVVDDDQ
jgi:hypothetical protein